MKTTPFDPRFPQTNQAKHCYTRYNEFHKCQAENGEGAEECEPLAKFYRSICPTEWTEKWNEEREEGTWPGRYWRTRVCVNVRRDALWKRAKSASFRNLTM